MSGLVALCWWQLLAAVFDGWHAHAALGASSWLMASIFANHVPYLLVISGAGGAWLHYRCGVCGTQLRVTVWLLALCSFAMTVVGVGAVVVHNIGSALANITPEPDTVRAVAGEEVVLAVGVLIAADLTARAMQRATAVRGQPATTGQSLP